MIIEVYAPELPESVSEAELGEWKVKVGDAVKRDQNLMDIETDKVVLELPAPNDGVIVEIIEQSGAVVKSKQLLAKIDTEAKASAGGSDAGAPAKGAEPAQAAPAAQAEPAKAQQSGVAMPAAQKLANEKNVDLSGKSGSGRDGRILKEDVMGMQGQASKAGSTQAAPQIQITGERPEQRVPMSRLRQRISERLLSSQQENAILTTFNEVNMQPVMDLRNRYKAQFEKQHGVKLGFMSFFVKAAVAALKLYPVVNASIDGKDIVYHGYFDIGVAIGTERGLVVPVLRNADLMSMADIELAIIDFAQKAKVGKLALEDLTGGTFSITNGGTFGSMMSTPIINPPQSAILGMHATKERAVVEDGQIVVRPMMYLAMSYDHRLIDGREAVLTLRAIKEFLEDPARLALGI